MPPSHIVNALPPSAELDAATLQTPVAQQGAVHQQGEWAGAAGVAFGPFPQHQLQLSFMLLHYRRSVPPVAAVPQQGAVHQQDQWVSTPGAALGPFPQH